MPIISQYIRHFQLSIKTKSPSISKTLHAQLVKVGLHQCEPLPNTLLNAYGKCSLNDDAHRLFDEMPKRDHVSWASILTAYNQANLPHKTISMFPSMFLLDGLQPDHFVFASLVKACASLGALRQGQQMHARFLSSPFSKDDVVKSSLVDMYAKCGLPDIARVVFDSILEKNPVSWTSMIYGYARSGQKDECILLFSKSPSRNLFCWTALISGFVQSGNGSDACLMFIKMQREKIDIIDPLVLSSITGACANLAMLGFGKQIHGLVICLGFDTCLFVSNALVDMYAKCTDIAAAKYIFNRMQHRDVVSWTSIIVGAAQHGCAEEALSKYDDMVLAGIKPNEVTFVGLLYACSHSGLVSKGRELFKSMKEDHRIKPSLQHYTCFLDLLSRSGFLEEAENLINSMPFEPDEPTWAALLSACKQHGKLELGVKIADRLLALKPEDPSTYILLSNVYATAAKWENVSKVRKLMEVLKVKKEPGYSCVDVGKESQVFHAGDLCHPMKEEIYCLLKELEEEMRKRGYVPDTSSVLHDMELQEKEKQLFLHSERLALAYGLLKSVEGTVIRIVKNLRVCGDCHKVMKLVSCIVKREIIVRDATRYHHFKDGLCSCKDFW